MAFVVFVITGVGLASYYSDANDSGTRSGIEGIESKQLTSDEQFLELADLPTNLAGKPPVEIIDILKSKIEIGEHLAATGGEYAERAIDQLVTIYGTLCYLQEQEGNDAESSYDRLDEIRQQALNAGNEARVAATNHFYAFAAVARLNWFTEPVDFRFAIDAVRNIKSKNLVDARKTRKLFLAAYKLHANADNQDATTTLLSVLAEKLEGSPVPVISNQGVKLKDLERYARYYVAIDETSYTTRESKLDFFRAMITEIESAPPQTAETYQVVFELLDRLMNKSDVFFASELMRRLREVVPMISPKFSRQVSASISNAETRISSLGKTVALTGSKFNGAPLQLPNDKPTTLVFWRHDNQKSMDYVKSLASSNRFNPWGTNVLVACLTQQPVEKFEKLSQKAGKFTVVDFPTSQRLGKGLAIEFVPYEVSLDKDGKVLGLGIPKK